MDRTNTPRIMCLASNSFSSAKCISENYIKYKKKRHKLILSAALLKDLKYSNAGDNIGKKSLIVVNEQD